MEQRTLGAGGLTVSAIGLGCMMLRDPETAPGVIRRAVDLGVTLFDTAEIYGPFSNEELVGATLASVREQVVIATKFGFAFDYATGTRTGEVDSRPEHIRAAVEGSLRRLGTNYIADESRHEQQYRQLKLGVVAHKRATTVTLRDRQVIDDTVLRQLQAQLDLEEVRLSGPATIE